MGEKRSQKKGGRTKEETRPGEEKGGSSQ